MEQTVKILCINNNTEYELPLGSNLEELYAMTGLSLLHGPVSAHVNNKV